MNNINFVKNIDNLGRIVIPMDVRRKLNINTGDVLSIIVENKNIVLSKYSSLDNNTKICEILKYYMELLNVKIILMNKECVIYSNVVSAGVKLNNLVKQLVLSGNNIRSEKKELIFGNNKVSGIYNMLPIITKDGIEGSIIVFGNDKDNQFIICELLSKIIMLELNIT